jgi:pheromone shutdown protein TraB
MSAPADSSESPESLESPPELPDASTPDESATAASNGASDSDAARTPDDAGSDTAAPEDDPRMNEEFVRRLPESNLTLVGVVHDHPASVHRARAVVRERAPEVVALEAPPLAVPLYEVYARDSRTPPAFGGEMSAAAQAASERDAEVVGIDAPTSDFFARLAENCWSETASLGTLRRVASGVAAVTRHALTCRLAAEVAERTSLRVEVDHPIDHDCSHADPPAVQARDECEQARRSRSLLRAFDPPRPVRLRDDTREECMAENLESLRSRGETVAIVGLDHLDTVAGRIE